MSGSETATVFCIVFITVVNLYLLMKSYSFDTEIKKQKAWNEVHEELHNDISHQTDEKIDAWVARMGEILEHNQAILNSDAKLIDECEAILKESAKINSDAETILGMYKGLTTKLNEGSNDELL